MRAQSDQVPKELLWRQILCRGYANIVEAEENPTPQAFTRFIESIFNNVIRGFAVFSTL